MGEVGPRRADDRLELGRIQLLGEVRSASTNGAYGTLPSPTLAQPPMRTRIPRADAIDATSATSRDLPTPGLAGDELVDR